MSCNQLHQEGSSGPSLLFKGLCSVRASRWEIGEAVTGSFKVDIYRSRRSGETRRRLI